MIGLALSATALVAIDAVFPNGLILGAILLNAVSFVGSVYYLRKLPKLPPDPSSKPKTSNRELKDGLKLIRQHRILWVRVLLACLVSLFVSPFMVVYVVANKEWFGGQFWTFAMFEIAFAIGLIASSLFLTRYRVSKPGIAFVVGMVLTGLFIAAMAFSRDIVWFTFWNLMCGLSLPFCNIPLKTHIQQIVPNQYLGRVQSVIMVFGEGITPIGMLLAGPMISGLGLVPMFLIMGIGIGATATIGLFDKEFRDSKMGEGVINLPQWDHVATPHTSAGGNQQGK
jgi:Na+/melibiose symporter-like transporter